ALGGKSTRGTLSVALRFDKGNHEIRNLESGSSGVAFATPPALPPTEITNTSRGELSRPMNRAAFPQRSKSSSLILRNGSVLHPHRFLHRCKRSGTCSAIPIALGR